MKKFIVLIMAIVLVMVSCGCSCISMKKSMKMYGKFTDMEGNTTYTYREYSIDKDGNIYDDSGDIELTEYEYYKLMKEA